MNRTETRRRSIAEAVTAVSVVLRDEIGLEQGQLAALRRAVEVLNDLFWRALEPPVTIASTEEEPHEPPR